MANAPAAMLMRWLLDVPKQAPLPADGRHVLKLMLDPRHVRHHLVNWREPCSLSVPPKSDASAGAQWPQGRS